MGDDPPVDCADNDSPSYQFKKMRGQGVLKSEPENTGAERWQKNRRHWNETLDAQNLRSGPAELDLRKQLALYETADVLRTMDFFEPLADQIVLDLGGGLGLYAILLARRGARVVIADLSPARLLLARGLAEKAGVADRIHFVCCSAENLPFTNGAFDRQTTKAVLIHTQLRKAAAELERTLSPTGRACFIEPLDSNPFVNLYRRLAAPEIWKAITNYFNPPSIRILMAPYLKADCQSRVERLYFLAFFATPFNYQLGWPGVYRIAERTLISLDTTLIKILPSLRRKCWFALIKLDRRKRE